MALKSPSLDSLIDVIADRVAAKVAAEIGGSSGTHRIHPRLLTVEQAANYIGRSKSSLQHMIAGGTLPVVRHDRRVFLDIQDLDRWIEQAKHQP